MTKHVWKTHKAKDKVKMFAAADLDYEFIQALSGIKLEKQC